MSFSVLPQQKTFSDPRQLLYHFPSISAIRYSKLASEFYHRKMIEIAEEMARLNGRILVPSCCIHWKRKADIEEKYKIKIGKHMFYILEPSKLTDNEKSKLAKYIQDQNEKTSEFSFNFAN